MPTRKRVQRLSRTLAAESLIPAFAGMTALGEGAPAMSERPRRFFLPLIGFTLLFAAFGPAIGGVLFAPIVVAAGGATWRAGGGKRRRDSRPCSGTGWRWSSPMSSASGRRRRRASSMRCGTRRRRRARRARSPRRSSAARSPIASICGSPRSARPFEASVGADVSAELAAWIDPWFPRGFDVTLRDALVACGAVAGLACAMAASLIGLTTRGALAPTRAAGALGRRLK